MEVERALQETMAQLMARMLEPLLADMMRAADFMEQLKRVGGRLALLEGMKRAGYGRIIKVISIRVRPEPPAATSITGINLPVEGGRTPCL